MSKLQQSSSALIADQPIRTSKPPMKHRPVSSSLEHIETSQQKLPPDSFHAYKVSFDPLEYAMTALAYVDFDKIDGTQKAEQLESCRRRAWFVRNRETGVVRVVSNACRLRWCPLCSRAHQNLIEHNVKDWLKETKQPKFLTLTLKHSDAPLAHQVDSLYKFFVKFRRLNEIKKTIKGGIWFFQIKKSEKDDLWHPHIHCVIDSDFIRQSVLSKLWLKTTASSSVVDIRQIKDTDSVSEYVARYCARPATLKPLGQFDVFELIAALHGRRLCGTWGTGRAVQLTMKSEPDKLAWQSIGHWSTVIRNMKYDENARKIFNAWKNNTPLESGVSMYAVENFIDSYTPYVHEQKKLPEPERTFWSEPVETKSKALEFYYA